MPSAADLAIGLGLGAATLAVGWVVFHRYEDRFINYV
jgi:hypothetical protein